MERRENTVVHSRTTILPFIDTSTNYVATTLAGMSISVVLTMVVNAIQTLSMNQLSNTDLASRMN